MWYMGGACSNTPPDIIIRNCWFNQQGNLLKQVFWHWMSHLSESMAMTPWSAMSFTILSVFELVNQVDRGLKWLTIQEDIQSYKSFQPCHSHVKSTKPIPPNFLPAGYAKVHGQLILRLLYAFHICLLVSWFCSFTLITYVIITSYTLLLCDSTLVHFGSCLV